MRSSGSCSSPNNGTIVTSYFDVGQSRSVPWHRRTHAARLLDDLRDPDRSWTGIVVGEGTRCWFDICSRKMQGEMHRKAMA